MAKQFIYSNKLNILCKYTSSYKSTFLADTFKKISNKIIMKIKNDNPQSKIVASGSGIGIRTPTVRVRVVSATVTQFR